MYIVTVKDGEKKWQETCLDGPSCNTDSMTAEQVLSKLIAIIQGPQPCEAGSFFTTPGATDMGSTM